MNLRPWLELARISNLPTAWTNVVAGWLLAGGQLGDVRLLWLLLGGSLLYSAGMILNDAADAGYDREHRKERPIPRGAVSVEAVWAVGIFGLIAGWVSMTYGGGADKFLGLLLVAAIVIYDVHHKSWVGSIFVMGACRVLLYLVAASPVLKCVRIWLGDATFWVFFGDSIFDAEVFLRSNSAGAVPSSCLPFAALALGLYIVGVTLLARWEGKRQATGVRLVLASALLFAPGVLSLLGLFANPDLFIFGPLIFVLLFASMVFYAIRIMRRGGPNIGKAVGILLAGITVVDSLAVATVSFSLACGFVALAPLLRLWQRKIAAT
jgi:4-hydroxybenzoate polyprenyltransferase